MRSPAAWVAIAVLLTAPLAEAEEGPSVDAEVERIASLRSQSLQTRRELQTSVLVAGIASVAGGVALAIPDDLDQGLRYAGFNTIAFGAINTAVGGIALYGIGQEQELEEKMREEAKASPEAYRRYRDHAMVDESREAVGHGINLGLAGAYAAIGGMAIAVSRLDVSHPNRWLGSGIAISAQAVHLAVVDLVGVLTANCYVSHFKSITPEVGYDPASGSSYAGASWGASF